MKRFLALSVAVLLSIGLLAGCTAPANSATSDPSSPAATNASTPADPATAGPSVILLIPGSLGDKSFFDSANEGIKQLETEYGCKTKVIEMGTDVAKFIPTFEDVIDEGWDIIVTGGINVAQPMAEMAEKFPDQKFMLYDESLDYADGKYPNVYCLTYKAYEGAYLMGALAAQVSTSDMPQANADKTIGFAGGFDIPLINDFLVGYIQGAQAVVPDIKVGVGYIGSFTDAAKGKEVGIALYNSGIDIVFQAAGGAGLGVLDAAKEMNKYAIGTDSDQSALFENDTAKANAILTSQLKRVDRSIVMAVGEHIAGTLTYGAAKSYGIKEGCIELANNQWYQKNVSEAIRTQIDGIYKRVAAGEVTVTSAFEMSAEKVAELKGSVQP